MTYRDRLEAAATKVAAGVRVRHVLEEYGVRRSDLYETLGAKGICIPRRGRPKLPPKPKRHITYPPFSLHIRPVPKVFRYNEEMRSRAVAMYMDGHSLQAIEKRIRISRAGIAYLLYVSGIDWRSPDAKAAHREYRTKGILRDLAAGSTPEQTAAKYRIAVQKVLDAKESFERKRKMEEETAAQMQNRMKVLDMRQSGMRFEEIGRQLGVTRQRAHQLYKDAVAKFGANTKKEDEDVHTNVL